MLSFMLTISYDTHMKSVTSFDYFNISFLDINILNVINKVNKLNDIYILDVLKNIWIY